MNEKIKVTLPGNISKEVDIETTTLEIIGTGKKAGQPLAAIVNGEIVELYRRLKADSNIVPINITDRIGYSIYARSISYMFVLAAHEVFKDASVVIDHAINNEIYGEIFCDREIDEKDILKIKEKMIEIVKSDDIIERVKVRKEEAEAIFKSYGANDKLSLLKNALDYEYVNLYKCRGMYDYFYGPMVPSTGYLELFDVMFMKPGFIIMLPEKKEIDKLPPFRHLPKLRSVYKETKKWAKILEVSNLGTINEKIETGKIKDVILVAEALHEKKISQIADSIYEHRDKLKVVLIAGPSSSGKTTFSNRLSIQLKVLGLEPHNIEADNYFVDRAHTPLKQNGEPDFESIKAVDVELLNEHLTELLKGNEIENPKYNFITGQREASGEKYKMTDKSILIVEGIHALNEELTPTIPKESKYKIYVSALTQLNLDNHNSMYVSDVRTLRRMIRDNRSRGNDAETTLIGWPSVREGEEKNIFPYQEEADIMFNSTIIYEMSVLKKYAEPLLKEIKSDSPAFTEATRILKLLRFFQDLDEKYIPQNSIIREFIGGSCFE
ncbi:phosphoribulokinase/uridine kinase [Gottschalkia acidurici 9a]|uniref:Phosphoribulokinase/uridine kinase n=1 Tax=Gottschalkia acidurici (strain ATCC 7906 / DSM 604 / BCRC 14475 / CIP 104303 / KCTC 5404 / NCIMB 10678 / 9a) TaxID=1128398 RepID=K0AZY4_GOTA9|nr:nucleoside kinase [Gottschalkia acidurici]AFS78844.1 phosphoribulokinase/uridine kinase [Gottschalkia acidurici 9a]